MALPEGARPIIDLGPLTLTAENIPKPWPPKPQDPPWDTEPLLVNSPLVKQL